MKRKVIQIADSTQLISLPRKWCKEHNIMKGAELDVLEESDRLVVFPQGKSKKMEVIQADVGGLGSSARVLVATLYKAGYDEFKITFKTSDELLAIQKVIKDNCLGFEIIEQGKNYVVTKKISETIPSEFDSVLRRTFVFLKNMSQDALTAVESGDSEALNTVVAMDSSINKFTYFCRRILNKHGKGSYRITCPLYYIVDEVEEIADRYKYICKDRLNIKGKILPELMFLFEEVNKMVETFHTVFYKFEWDKMIKIRDMKKNIDAKVPDFMNKIKKEELRLLVNLLIIADKVYELDGPLALARFEPEVLA